MVGARQKYPLWPFLQLQLVSVPPDGLIRHRRLVNALKRVLQSLDSIGDLIIGCSSPPRPIFVVFSSSFRCFFVVFSFVFRLVLYRQTNDERETNERRTRTERKGNEKRSRTERKWTEKRLKFSVFCKQVCLHIAFILLKMLAYYI